MPETRNTELEEIAKSFIQEAFPIEYQDHTIEVSNINFKYPKDTSRQAEDEAFNKGDTYRFQLRGDVLIKNGDKTLVDDKNILIANLPFMTERGTYIIKGDEKVFINQMVLREGVYVRPIRNVDNKSVIDAQVRSGKKRFTIRYDITNQNITISDLGMDFGYGGKRVDAIAFLLLMGVTENRIREAIGNEEVANHMIENASKYDMKRIHDSFFESEMPATQEEVVEKINEYLSGVLTFSERGQRIQSEIIGKSYDHFSPDAFLSTIEQLVTEKEEPGATPNTDDIRFKEVISGAGVIGKGVEKGIFDWTRKMKERIRRGNVKSSTVRPSTYIEGQLAETYNSSLAERIDSSNPLDLAQKKRKITLGGSGGLSDRAVTEENRNLLEGEFSKIDPIETPQTSKLGVNQHLAQDAVIRNGEIYSKFYAVRNGVVNTDSFVTDVDTFDEFDEVIAFHNLENIEEEKGKMRLVSDTGTVRARHKGDFIDAKIEDVTLIDWKPDAHLGRASALVPFSSHNDGSRMLMGASMQRQALPLENAEAPLVQSISDPRTGETVEQAVAKENSNILKSPVSGRVTRIADDFIEITTSDGKKEKVKKLNYHSPGSSGGFVNHTPVVKVGDTIKQGELLADGWQSKGGTLALGKNTKVAYLSFDGYNHEDGVVVSESWAKSMASEEIKTITYEIEKNELTVPFNETKNALKDLFVSDGVISKLDKDGVVKKGEKIAAGDIFVGLVAKREQKDLSLAERIVQRSIIEDPTDGFVDRSKYAKGYQRGTIVDVYKDVTDEGMKVTLKLLTFKEMGEGDKVSGRHGNKGTVSKVVPDDEMPRTEDGEVVDLIFSPLAVPSRKNIGQLLEVNAGLVAEKKGMSSYNIQNFNKKEKEKLFKELEEIGVPDGKMTLINPKTGKPYENKITVGPMYVMRLDHNAESKITATSYGAEDPVTGLPRKVSGSIDGDRTNPQTVGGMEFWALTSAGAVNNIHEMTTLKSDGSGTGEDKSARLKIFNAIKHGSPLPEPATPETLKVMQDQLLGAGIKMTPLRDGKETAIEKEFNELMLQPVKPSVLSSMAKGEVEESKTIDGRTGEAAPKGLYSEDTFGKDGDKWGRISLEDPIPNPIFLWSRAATRPYEAMLQSKGLTNGDLNKVIEGGHFVVTDEGDSGKNKFDIITAEEYEELDDIEGKDITAITGPGALGHLLKDVNLEDELRLTEKNLQDPDRSVKDKSRDEQYFKTLSRAIDQGYKPEDFLLPFVPVLPVKYRKPVKSGNGAVAEDGITLMYQQLMKQNDSYRKTLDAYGGDKTLLDKQTLAEIEKDRYETISQIVGVKPYIDSKRGTEFEGILTRMKGKEGFIRDKLQSKTQNYSARSVIIVDPVLDMDEAGVPEDMAAEIFKPHIQKKLQDKRFTAKEIKKITEERTPEFREALQAVADEEVIILNRQPSLHRHSVQAFHPKIRWDNGNEKKKAIGLNAIVTTGFNADFDGDQMNVHVPITEAAKKEAREHLMPSQNLLNPTSNSVIMELKHEMQLGLFYLTRDKMPEGKPVVFKGYKELVKAYHKADVRTYDAAIVENVPGKGRVESTVGKHVFNSALPTKMINYDKYKNVKKGQIEALITEVMDDETLGPKEATALINRLKTLGFKASTISAISIGARDFDPIVDVDKDELFKRSEKELTKGGNAATFIDNKEAFEKAKVDFVSNEIEKMLKDGVLGEDNDVNTILQSGARGGAGSYVAMGGIVGKLRNVSSEDIRPMKASLLEGSRPDEFWDLANDSRKGIFDRSVATSGPGELSRMLWSTNKQTVISEKDCGDKVGIVLDLSKPSDSKGLYGRILLEDVPLRGGGIVKARRGVPLTRKEVDKIRKDAQNKSRIRVRSPLTCKTADGICQHCYGMKPGAMQAELVSIGTPVGSIASQAIGEPAAQSIMKTFHTGGGGNELSSAFEGTKNVLTLKEPANKAVVAEKDGVVTEIITDPIKGTTVVTSSKRYNLKKKPISDDLKVGVEVKKGDVLTKLKDKSGQVLTVVDPKDALKFGGLGTAQAYLTEQIEDSFTVGGIDHIDRRHTELVVSNMSNHGIVTDGGTSGLQASREFDRKKMESFNAGGKVTNAALTYEERGAVIGAKAAQDYREGIGFGPMIVKKGEVITEEMWEKLKKSRKFVKVETKKVGFDPLLKGIGADNAMPDDNWLDSAGYRDSTRFITKGTGEFATDKIDNPLTQQMTGVRGGFATNFQNWKENMKSRFGDTLM